MGGAIDWAALDVVVEYYGIQDIELFITELVAVRDHAARQAKNG